MWARREGENILDIVKAKITICPPLLEIACIELGRLGDPKAIETLIKILKSDASSGRAEAALALGAIAGREAIDALVAALEDPKDGWVRFCAYEALRKLSGQDHMCDWIFGTADFRRDLFPRTGDPEAPEALATGGWLRQQAVGLRRMAGALVGRGGG